MTFCVATAGNGVSFWTHGWRTDGGGRTDRRGSRNSYLDRQNPIKGYPLSFERGRPKKQTNKTMPT